MFPIIRDRDHFLVLEQELTSICDSFQLVNITNSGFRYFPTFALIIFRFNNTLFKNLLINNQRTKNFLPKTFILILKQRNQNTFPHWWWWDLCPFQTFKQINDFSSWSAPRWLLTLWQDIKESDHNKPLMISRLMGWNNHVSRSSSGGQWRFSHTMTGHSPLPSSIEIWTTVLSGWRLWIYRIYSLAEHYIQHRPASHILTTHSLHYSFCFFINMSQIGQITFDYPLFNQKITNEKKTN